MSALPLPLPCDPNEWFCPSPLPPAEFVRLRQRLVLDHFKWDPQVGDVETIARFPLVLPASTVRRLFALAEALAAETVAAEQELLSRPDLLARLGLPRRIRRILADDSMSPTPAAARVIRFDFHPTTAGWRISEANSDVPGGYAESSYLPRLMAEHWPGLGPAGDPVAALTESLGTPGRVGLLAAPGYMEDQQVIACLADALRRLGWNVSLGHPGQVEWDVGQARLRTAAGIVPLDLAVRFFQGEWLARLPDAVRWRPFFRGGITAVCNPGIALVTESKRFPLVWDELATPIATWRALLPETRDPRDADWRRNPGWLLKAAFGNNGDDVVERGSAGRKTWRSAAWDARLSPRAWVAQRRFATLPVETPAGPMFPCLGVYTITGRAAGIYGRIAPKPFIDYAAVDVAVLVKGGNRE
jgi:hypothetical protein